MINNNRLALFASLTLLLGGCAGNAIPRATPPKAPSSAGPITAPRPTQNNSLIGRSANSALSLFGKLTPVPPMPQYPSGFFARYCWWYGSA